MSGNVQILTNSLQKFKISRKYIESHLLQISEEFDIVFKIAEQVKEILKMILLPLSLFSIQIHVYASVSVLHICIYISKRFRTSERFVVIYDPTMRYIF